MYVCAVFINYVLLLLFDDGLIFNSGFQIGVIRYVVKRPKIAQKAGFEESHYTTLKTHARRLLSPQKRNLTKTLDILIIHCYNIFTYYY